MVAFEDCKFNYGDRTRLDAKLNMEISNSYLKITGKTIYQYFGNEGFHEYKRDGKEVDIRVPLTDSIIMDIVAMFIKESEDRRRQASRSLSEARAKIRDLQNENKKMRETFDMFKQFSSQSRSIE